MREKQSRPARDRQAAPSSSRRHLRDPPTSLGCAGPWMGRVTRARLRITSQMKEQSSANMSKQGKGRRGEGDGRRRGGPRPLRPAKGAKTLS